VLGGLAARRGTGASGGPESGSWVANVPQWAVLYYGALRAGVRGIPMNPLLKEREIAFCLRDSVQGDLRLGRIQRGGRSRRETDRAEAVTVDQPGSNNC